jgi:hypothetical protein
MTGWQPLSVRRGIRSPAEPFEGVPSHLRHPLAEWIRTRFGWHRKGGMNSSDSAFMATIASRLRIPVIPTYKLGYQSGGISDQILDAIERDEDLYLDCIDACLNLSKVNPSGLKDILQTGGSAWTVNTSGDGLERQVNETTKNAFLRVSEPADAASTEIAAAWAAVYGRGPDPSDGWDHAIKAVEELLIPIVVPSEPKANLGGVAGQLKANPSKWSFGLPANGARNNGETLEGMIRHIWPNPDRHGGATKRAPTQAEAEAVLQLAIAIIELCRGRLIKLP